MHPAPSENYNMSDFNVCQVAFERLSEWVTGIAKSGYVRRVEIISRMIRRSSRFAHRTRLALIQMDSKKKGLSQRSAASEVSDLEDEGALDIYRLRELLVIDSERFGLREQNKVDKLQRIYLAARRQFAEVGYDATTLRDVAKEARVALGTLSFYAESKSELVLLVFNATMPPVFAKCREEGQYKDSLLEALTAYFGPAFKAYSEEPGLFRVLLRENVFHTTSLHSREFHRLRSDTLRDLRKLIDQARENGEIRPYIDLDLTARTIFFLMFASVRIWISSGQPKADAGLTELKQMISLLLDGLRANTFERSHETSRKKRTRESI